MSNNKKFYTLKDVAKITKISPQTIKYWQRAYKIRLKKNKSGRYLYTQDDINKILLIKQLRLNDKLSLAGVKKRLAEMTRVLSPSLADKNATFPTVKLGNNILNIRQELLAIKYLLEKILTDTNLEELVKT
jgi:DNA-binding transcriptional MerR regulator